MGKSKSSQKNGVKIRIFSCSSGGLFEFNTINFDFVLNKLIHVGYNCGTLNVHENKRRCQCGFQSTICTSDGSRIDVKAIFMLVSLEFVSVACDQNITIQLAVDRC